MSVSESVTVPLVSTYLFAFYSRQNIQLFMKRNKNAITVTSDGLDTPLHGAARLAIFFLPQRNDWSYSQSLAGRFSGHPGN